MPGRTPFSFNFAAGGVGVGSIPLLTTLIAAPVSIRPFNSFPSIVTGISRNSLVNPQDGLFAPSVAAAGTNSDAATFSFPS